MLSAYDMSSSQDRCNLHTTAASEIQQKQCCFDQCCVVGIYVVDTVWPEAFYSGVSKSLDPCRCPLDWRPHQILASQQFFSAVNSNQLARLLIQIPPLFPSTFHSTFALDIDESHLGALLAWTSRFGESAMQHHNPASVTVKVDRDRFISTRNAVCLPTVLLTPPRLML